MEGFIVGDGSYAAIPFGKQLMIIYNGQQLKVCRTEASARKFISDHKKHKDIVTVEELSQAPSKGALDAL